MFSRSVEGESVGQRTECQGPVGEGSQYVECEKEGGGQLEESQLMSGPVVGASAASERRESVCRVRGGGEQLEERQ